MSSMDKQNLIFPLSYDPDLKEKEDFMMRRKTYQEPSFFNASETDWTYADITR